jgi:hypothetical protein
VLTALRESQLLAAVAAVRRGGGRALALGETRIRPLSGAEVAQLERLGNTCDDWARVQVAEGFDGARVRHSYFHGDVILGAFTGQACAAEGIRVPTGIYHSTVAGSVIGNDALVRDVKLLASHVVGPAAVLWNCGSITCDSLTRFGNGAALPVGPATGGREVPIFAEIDIEVAAAVARYRARRDWQVHYGRLVEAYAAAAASRLGIIERGVVLRNTTTLRNTYLGPHAEVDGATLVSECTVLSQPGEPAHIRSGACVTDSLLQWGAGAATMAIVEHSVLTEHAHAEQHAKVSASILGPNTTVAGGEVTASLLGPFVGFHHQALLIAALWPEGKGNVSYGANAGSNHTTRAPDQEFMPGEGLFLGLGVNIKFPSDFSRAPYTVIASGLSTLPQKLTFPFSLVSAPSNGYPGVSPAYNEIVPAWVLTDNFFALARNQAKYRARNQARRLGLALDVFRPDTVDLILDAARRLEAVGEIRPVYTEAQVAGIGKNFMLESSRQYAVAAYRLYARYYALLGLLGRVRLALNEGQPEDGARLLLTPSADPRWEHQRQLLTQYLQVPDVLTGLRQLPDLLDQVAASVERSKTKDDERGARIIDDYADAHPPAAEDQFVQQTWEETRSLQREVQEQIGRLGATRPVWDPPSRAETNQRVMHGPGDGQLTTPLHRDLLSSA